MKKSLFWRKKTTKNQETKKPKQPEWAEQLDVYSIAAHLWKECFKKSSEDGWT